MLNSSCCGTLHEAGLNVKSVPIRSENVGEPGYDFAMEALPETRAALAKLKADLQDNPDPASPMAAIGDVIAAVVPSCVGVSLTVIYEGEALTFTATSLPAATVDAG